MVYTDIDKLVFVLLQEETKEETNVRVWHKDKQGHPADLLLSPCCLGTSVFKLKCHICMLDPAGSTKRRYGAMS